MLCENCYINCVRMVNGLLGIPIPMNAIGCLTEKCETDLLQKLYELTQKRREERLKK